MPTKEDMETLVHEIVRSDEARITVKPGLRQAEAQRQPPFRREFHGFELSGNLSGSPPVALGY